MKEEGEGEVVLVGEEGESASPVEEVGGRWTTKAQIVAEVLLNSHNKITAVHIYLSLKL